MKKYIILFVAAIMGLSLTSCVDEEGAGVPVPPKMLLESPEYSVDLSDAEQTSLTLRWIDVKNATYSVFFSNNENETTMPLNNTVTAGELNVLSMDIPYSQIKSYIETAAIEPVEGIYTILLNVTGTPVDMNQPTSLEPTGSTAQATILVSGLNEEGEE